MREAEGEGEGRVTGERDAIELLLEERQGLDTRRTDSPGRAEADLPCAHHSVSLQKDFLYTPA